MQATIMFAESLALNLDLRFTEPAAPLFIDIDGDLSETLFVISTNQVREEDIPSGVQPRVHAPSREESMQPRGRKRELESAEPEAHGHDEAGVHARGTVTPSSARKKPQKVVVHADRDSVARELQGSQCRSSVVRSMPPPSLPPHSMNPLAPPQVEREPLFLPGSQVEREPLFLPGSQVPLSQAAEAAIRASGLGIENMTVDEFAAMMEDEGEEVGAGAPAEDAQDAEMGEERDELEDEIMRESSFDLYEDTHTEFAPTQGDVSAKVRISYWHNVC
ncbi:uncharacterized protein PHACADRAFT_105856 [Phanerochaete carnosa HHB-10118-sp]|uniref:Uncharacterized protein n=1 Tax=Phanerochaete carnosa (strain HHB-10118-sp) TaxID=650164 RepID=K5UKA0_PHACS|nr:uncharacterized protein PHACADRAFT_105856 [Phanerochaete carnosa HHB-10118-sp]EKM50031.1 hypothetical protein PHACADRAFT_105856 [Phanerochaete carnosa HHB-10118-sp]